MNAATIKGVVADHQSLVEEHGGFGFIETWTSVLGKPACHSTGYVPIAARIRNYPVDGSPSYDEDVVIVRRLDLEVSQNKLTYSMATAHLAITRHTLERLYARADCHHTTFAHTVEDELLRTLCGLAIAVAAEVGHIQPSVPADYHHHAIPFGSGLMILDGRLFTDWNSYGAQRMPLAQHTVLKGGKTIARRPLLSRFNSMTIAHPELKPETVWASRVFTSRTYVDRDDMGRIKMEYCERFNRLLDDYDFQPLLQAYFRPRPHENHEPIEIDLPEPALEMLADLETAGRGVFNVDRALPVCSVWKQGGDIREHPKNGNALEARDNTRPMSTQEMTVVAVAHLGSGTRAYARGKATIPDSAATREISFMVQGCHYVRLVDLLQPGKRLQVPVRWTGPSSLTIVGPTSPALDTR
ncbi:hypothetical protein [Sphingomonas sp. 3-13AW]|uniref:hypothetical protein n=1 Tax=Sphingomonas sp. 3-13AW TaxID=3050450 RepID=UPI003BB805DF